MVNQIIQTVPAISNEASGPSYSVVRLCESLIAAGQVITLAALDWAPMSSSPEFLRTFPLGFGPRRLGSSPAMRRWLVEQAKDGKCDLLHNHSLWMMPNVYPGHVASRFKLPLLVSPRGTLSDWAFTSGSWTKRIFWPLMQRPALVGATCFHATAVSEYEDIRRMGFRQPVAIIPNGVDIPALANETTCGMRTLLFLGRIHPIKGLDMLLPAWAAVQARFPDWRLRITGPDNGYLSQARNLASALGLQRVEFSGALYGEEKWHAYQDADLFVLPTYSENFGMSVAEALAAGTPAIVTQGAPWSGLVTEKAGLWIEIGLDPLVAALEALLLHSHDELSAMGQRGRAWMERDYSWTYIGQQMAGVYAWLLGHTSTPPSCLRLD